MSIEYPNATTLNEAQKRPVDYPNVNEAISSLVGSINQIVVGANEFIIEVAKMLEIEVKEGERLEIKAFQEAIDKLRTRGEQK